MADPDNDPNAQPDLESDAQPEATSLPLQPPGSVSRTTSTPNHNVSVPRQSPQTDFGHRLEGETAQPKGPPESGPMPTALP